MKRFLILTAIIAMATIALTTPQTQAAAPQLINFQSLLADSTGSPVADGNYSVAFTIWDAAAAGTSVWTETQNVSTAGGVFSVLLGSINPVEDTVFNGTTRYLGIEVNGDPELSPRTALVSVPYSQRVNTVDGASGGHITSKGSIGPGHTNTGADAFIAGAENTASGDSATVGGGSGNTASGRTSTVGGGLNNSAAGNQATVAGGWNNTIGTSAALGTIGGGANNVVDSGVNATVAGGNSNQAIAFEATVGGGSFNLVTGSNSTIGGGSGNLASGYRSTMAGGQQGIASGAYSTVGGGARNYAHGEGSVVAGGGGYTTFADTNSAQGAFSVIGGGQKNATIDSFTTIGGGTANQASAYGATIPGGVSNDASGVYSYAAGRRAKASHTGSHVWADATDADFTSTGDNQFLVRAGGGMGINTNAPSAALHVGGTPGVDGIKFPDGTLQTTAAGGGSSSGWVDDGSTVRLESASDFVGIGTTSPNSRLQVAGSFATPVTIITSNLTLDATHSVIIADPTSGNVFVKLPSPAGITGRRYTIKRTNFPGNDVFVEPASFPIDKLDGVGVLQLDGSNAFITVVSDGTDWWVIAGMGIVP